MRDVGFVAVIKPETVGRRRINHVFIFRKDHGSEPS